MPSVPEFDAGLQRCNGAFPGAGRPAASEAWYPNLWGFWHHAGTWSISVEFFLYASFPLLLGLNRLPTRALVMVCVACVLMAGSWIPSLGVGASSDIPFPVFYSTPIYSLPTFAIGVALAELHRRGFKGHGAAPVLLLAVLAFAGQFNTRYAGLNLVTLPLIATTLLFAARYRRGEGVARLFINRATVYLGDISYAFFVFQIPLLLMLEHYIGAARALPPWSVGVLMLGVNLLLAAASHHWFEPWAGRAIRKRGHERSPQIVQRDRRSSEPGLSAASEGPPRAPAVECAALPK